MKKKIEDFITENEWENLIYQNKYKWEKWEEDNKRHLILGLGGDWYYNDKFLQDRVQEIHGEETNDMPLWQNNTIKYYNRIFLRVFRENKHRLMKYYNLQ